MGRPPEWTEEEFEIFLMHSDLSSEELTELLPQRTSAVIEVLRAFIHYYHQGGSQVEASRIMQQRLESSNGLLTCPRCKVTF